MHREDDRTQEEEMEEEEPKENVIYFEIMLTNQKKMEGHKR